MSSAQILYNQVNLLPPAIAETVRLRRNFFVWFVVVSSALAVLISTMIVVGMHYQQSRQRNEQLVAAAIPLMDLRQDVIQLRAENHRRNQWCDFVESAKPNDDVLQSLAAIAARTDDTVLIDTVLVRLPVEHAGDVDSPPEWSLPKLEVTARVPLANSVSGWVERLSQSDRIQTPVLTEDNDLEQANVLRLQDNATRRIELSAIPAFTGVLP